MKLSGLNDRELIEYYKVKSLFVGLTDYIELNNELLKRFEYLVDKHNRAMATIERRKKLYGKN